MTSPIKTRSKSPCILLHGDALAVLRDVPSNSIDLVCTDPPYGYSFMGKSWDKSLPNIGIFIESLRVLKPGAFAFVMSAPRSDVCSRMMLMLEEAGFEIGFTPIYWTYASGFPKAMSIGKAARKRTSARADDARVLDGSYGGFQPKPAVEVIIVAMKPLSERTYVDQALKNGKGLTWLDDARIPIGNETVPRLNKAYKRKGGRSFGDGRDRRLGTVTGHGSAGRFPANLLVSDDVLSSGIATRGASGAGPGCAGGHSRFFSLDAWCLPLSMQGTFPFLPVAKASKREKDATPATRNGHPTVKPLKLMQYLVVLGSRKGDVVLDPFLGSGTTAIAATTLDRRCIGVERELEYVRIARARLATIGLEKP